MANYVEETPPDELKALPEYLARQFRLISIAIQELGQHFVVTHSTGSAFNRNGYRPRETETGKGTKVLHAAANTSDLVVALQDGNGRVNFYWNATPTVPNRYIVSNEAAFRVTWHTASDANNGFHFHWAASATASTTISWIELFRIRTDGRIQFPSFTQATLPAATTAACMAFCSDETGGATMVFSDGTNWRRVQDRAVVS